MVYQHFTSEFLDYLTSTIDGNGDNEQLPSLTSLSEELQISVSRLREQLEVAKALGMVDVRPRLGIRRLPYSFLPAIWPSLAYAMAVDMKHFQDFSDLRHHIEASYWDQAVKMLTDEDHSSLHDLMDRAWEKLNGSPIRIPHDEHRELHLLIYRRLENPFVLGILEAYWEAYEAVGLNVYADYEYLQEVWSYHQKMVDAICRGDFELGYQALVEHKDLLYHRSVNEPED
jgi:DNA-binding FadR family transcriptional regulator